MFACVEGGRGRMDVDVAVAVKVQDQISDNYICAFQRFISQLYV